ncbi:Lrp/AsnC family transcriptional regulator [Candidatus Woesearchaeota archaeon]|nr:Lrp/AsnC family transcriptional regulator [Candidatus Woesearchaeota archaeon]
MIDKIKAKLEIDDKDRTIISMLSKNPDTSQTQLADATKLSQPAIGMRLLRLKQKGILTHTIGLNFKKVNLFLGKVDVTAKDPETVVQEFKDCPYFLNALVMSGEFNLCLFFMAPDLKLLETIVNHHLRAKDNIIKVSFNIMITSAKDFIFPISMGPSDGTCCSSGLCRDSDSEFMFDYSPLKEAVKFPKKD